MSRKNTLKYLFVYFLIFSLCLNAEEDTPRKSLSQAIETGNLAQVQSLIESSRVGIDELSEGYNAQSPILEAASNAHIHIIKYLVEKGAYIDGASKYGHSLLVEYIKAGKRVPPQQLIGAIRWLVDCGADVNSVDSSGYTPLMAACEHTRCVELVEILLDKGALIDARARDENTAYLLSLRKNNIKAYRLLVSRGANTNMTWKGLRPFSVLAFEGNIVMAKTLLEDERINVNDYNENGTTPLICATIGRQSAMAQFLLEKGANINAKTSTSVYIEVPKNIYSIWKTYVIFPRGCTALNFAKTMGTAAIADLLSSQGGILYQEVEYKEVTDRW